MAPISGRVYRGIMALEPQPLGQLVLELLQLEAEPGVVDGYGRTRAFYRSVGFIPARELPNLWPNQKALLFAMPLGEDH
jgi:hypothetical protein